MDSTLGNSESVKKSLREELSETQQPFSFHLHGQDEWIGHSPTSSHVKRFVQVIDDLRHEPWESLRILDLGCLEGGHAFEFAHRGAHVVAVEGRESGIAKGEFTKYVTKQDRVEFCLDDVRNVSLEKYGKFDFILCSGLLYHLDGESVFNLAENLAKMTKHASIFDTHCALLPKAEINIKKTTYMGAVIEEHNANANEKEKIQNVWQSIDNQTSFHYTKYSLFNLLKDAGFTTVFDCAIPCVFWGAGDRSTLVALSGVPVQEIYTAKDNLVSEQYAEINSGMNHSELHALANKYLVFSKLPLIRLHLFLSRVRKKALSLCVNRKLL